MTQQIEWLNDIIDKMQAGVSSLPSGSDTDKWLSGEQLALLRMSAHLNSLRPGADRPQPEFLARLQTQLSKATAER